MPRLRSRAEGYHRSLRGARPSLLASQLVRGAQARGGRGRGAVSGLQPQGAATLPATLAHAERSPPAASALHSQPAVDAQGRSRGSQDQRALRRGDGPGGAPAPSPGASVLRAGGPSPRARRAPRPTRGSHDPPPAAVHPSLLGRGRLRHLLLLPVFCLSHRLGR